MTPRHSGDRASRLAVSALAAALSCTAMLALAQPAPVAVSDAWIRGTVPGQPTTGAYMTLTAAQPVTLVRVSTPAAKVAELHEMAMEGGVMRMRPVGRLALRPGNAVALTPNAKHIMLVDLTRALKEGEQVPITLTFADSGGKRSTLEVNAVVRPLATTATGSAHHH